MDWDDNLTPSDNLVDEIWKKFKIIVCDGIKQFNPIRKLHSTISKKNFSLFQPT